VLSQDNTNEWAKSGIMVKGSATEGATYAALMVTPGHGAHLQSNFVDDASGAAIVPPGAWLRLTRAGNTFTAYTSVDGSVWTLLGSRTVTIPSTAEVGLFVSSHNGAAVNTTTFSDVTVSPAGAGTLPAGWTHVDIGGPSVAGTATVNGRTYTVSGAGSDIWGGADQLHYASVPLAGDGSIVARVLSQDNTDEWAKSGVMVKSAATAGSDYVAAVLTPGHGLRVQAHFTADADGGAAAAPVWLKLSRTGSTVSIFRSTNGADWTLVGTETLAGTATVGLFVSSHNSGALNTTVFDNVTVTS
jgi:regulation of enolase protein 1 (concanavalin A-like superfamily)